MIQINKWKGLNWNGFKLPLWPPSSFQPPGPSFGIHLAILYSPRPPYSEREGPFIQVSNVRGISPLFLFYLHIKRDLPVEWMMVMIFLLKSKARNSDMLNIFIGSLHKGLRGLSVKRESVHISHSVKIKEIIDIAALKQSAVLRRTCLRSTALELCSKNIWEPLSLQQYLFWG